MSYREALNVFDLQELARRRLPFPLYSYIEGGVEDNQARDNNRSVFQRIRFRQRSPIDVSQRSQSVEMFGHRFDSPFGISPMGIGGMFAFEAGLQYEGAVHPRWSVETFARTLAKYGVPRLENLVRGGNPTWLGPEH